MCLIVSLYQIMALKDGRKAQFDREECILIIFAMSRPIHDTIALLVYSFLISAANSQLK